MKLPGYILECISMLEQAGHAAYAVGGCVRDALLGLTPHDYDLCTDAVPEQIRHIFRDYPLVLSGEKHGTVSVVMDHRLVEITTFRTEGDYEDNRHPGWVRFVPDIRSDLGRRDFTVNAMAFSPTRGFADPYGGREDLKNKVLRAVGDPRQRFREDSLRILRGVRFAVRYNLTPEPETLEAMFELRSLMDNLARERVLDELCKLLPAVKAQDLIRFAPILVQALPELGPCVGFEQHSPYHAYDVYTHTAYVVEQVPPVLHLRFAALLHDVGKPEAFYRDEGGRGHFPDHGARSARLAGEALRRLKASNDLRSRVVSLVERHMIPPEADKRLLKRRMSKFGAEFMEDLLVLQRADYHSKGTKEETDVFGRIGEMMQELREEQACLSLKDLAVNGRDLMELGFPADRSIGRCLSHLLELVLEDKCPNQRQHLLAAARAFKEEAL